MSGPGIPVEILDQYANCFITKPVERDAFLAAVCSIEEFWLTIVRLPPNDHSRPRAGESTPRAPAGERP